MKISVTDGESAADRPRQTGRGKEDVVLTRHGQSVARLTPIRRAKAREERRGILEEISRAAAGKALLGACAARSQDFLYDEDGLPA